ncbi:hypothetical protein N9V90_00530, partial [Endozoicomonas sp.]|nr:hypothetical protein [Endozoicomonas sp.]
IGLTMRLSDTTEARAEAKQPAKERHASKQAKPQARSNRNQNTRKKKEVAVGTFADLFASAKKLRK